MINIDIMSTGDKGRVAIVDFINDEELFNTNKDNYESEGYGVVKITIDTHYLTEEDAHEINQHLLKEEYDLVVPIVDKRTLGMMTSEEDDENENKENVAED